VGRARVLIAGGGVTAIETALALQAFAPDLAEVSLLAPDEPLELTPLSVLEPFDGYVTPSYPLEPIARAAGAALVPGRLARVEAEGHAVVTEDGLRLGYERLVIAVGGRRQAFLDGAMTFAGPSEVGAVREMLGRIRRGAAQGVRTRIAFVVPPGAGWPLPAYELALLTADHLSRARVRDAAELALVTAEDRPLAAFGEAAASEVAADLASAGIDARCGAVVRAWAMGRLHLIPRDEVAVDRVVALAALRGQAIPGLPHDALGFAQADHAGRVRGCDDVYVVGDAGPFPIKHGGVGCQQADAVASLIARDVGADVEEWPYEPELTALLLERREDRFVEQRFVRAHPTIAGEASLGESWLYQLRAPAGKIAGHFLGPFLEAWGSRVPIAP